jgi:hypothetical protein
VFHVGTNDLSNDHLPTLQGMLLPWLWAACIVVKKVILVLPQQEVPAWFCL